MAEDIKYFKDKIVMDIYREMYKRATPPADFDKLVKTGETRKRDFYLNYYLNSKTQDVIINKHAKRHKMSGLDKECLETVIHLGCSPTEIKRG